MARAADLVLGLWLDAPRPAHGGVDVWLERLRAVDGRLVFRRLVVSLNAGTGHLHLPTWDQDALLTLTRKAQAMGVQVDWMAWLIATPPAIQQTVQALGALWTRAAAAGVDLEQLGQQWDAEGPGNSSGWGPAGADLAAKLVEALTQLPHKPGRWSVTAVPPLAGIRRQDAKLVQAHTEAGLFCEVWPQGYSKDDLTKGWDDARLYRPGVIQGHAAQQWRALGLPVWGGLMVAHQDHPKPWPVGHQAILEAVASYLWHGVHQVAFWAHRAFPSEQWQTRSGLVGLMDQLTHPDSAAALDALVDQVPRNVLRGASQQPGALEIQTALARAGLNPGKLDGIMGARTQAALATWQAQRAALGLDGSLKALLEP